MRHIIAILLQNEAGSLARVAGLFSTRAYNIESLSVAPTDNPAVSRLTLVTTGDDAVLAQIASQLRKLIDVVGVEDLTGDSHIERELLLVKLRVTPQSLEGLSRVITESSARILSGVLSNFVVEITSNEAQASRFLAQVSQFGEILEVVRSGALGIRQGRSAE
ncbi:MAG: acetolactate synthase small subunit [Pseudomonadota bacterium]|jgi:acetolactate synthase-1/3 small subunit